jgi:hypothetical protein
MTAQPSRSELDKQRHDLTNMLLIAQEQMAPIFDAADGIRSDLAKRGWSPTAAEQAALTWLCAAIGSAFGSQQ